MGLLVLALYPYGSTKQDSTFGDISAIDLILIGVMGLHLVYARMIERQITPLSLFA